MVGLASMTAEREAAIRKACDTVQQNMEACPWPACGCTMFPAAFAGGEAFALQNAATPPGARKVVAITADAKGFLTAAADDGTIWEGNGIKWIKLSSLPARTTP